MTLALVKTKAEQAFVEQFGSVADILPGDADVLASRRAAIGRFAALGLPHRRIEEWKYTDLRAALKEAYPPIETPVPVTTEALNAALGPELAALDCVRLVFADGLYQHDVSKLDDGHGDAYHFDPTSRGLAYGFSWLKAHFAESGEGRSGAIPALNAAFARDGALIRVDAGARLEKPFHLVFFSSDAAPAAVHLRSMIEVCPGARATIIETHVGGASRQTSAVTDIEIEKGARADHILTLGPGPSPVHLGTWFARLHEDADYRAFHFASGRALARNELFVTFVGEDANLDISGAFLARGGEHIDTTLVVDHAVPGCTSRELFKGVLDNHARGVFQGKIIVRPDAQKTDGKQMAQALMLSPDAEFDSKPELEIYADDVVCGHGSTAAELDEDLLFYCRARGIPLAEARALLTEAFVGEAIEKVQHEGLREALMGAARGWLANAV